MRLTPRMVSVAGAEILPVSFLGFAKSYHRGNVSSLPIPASEPGPVRVTQSRPPSRDPLGVQPNSPKRKPPDTKSGGSRKRASWRWPIFRRGLPPQYRQRCGVSLPCSGWERVGPPRSNHQLPEILARTRREARVSSRSFPHRKARQCHSDYMLTGSKSRTTSPSRMISSTAKRQSRLSPMSSAISTDRALWRLTQAGAWGRQPFSRCGPHSFAAGHSLFSTSTPGKLTSLKNLLLRFHLSLQRR